MTRLARLLAEAGLPAAAADADPVVTRVVYDSRSSRPGALFVAIPGVHVDGHDFAAAAVRAGAVAVVAERPPRPEARGVPVVMVPDSRAALAPLAAAFFGRPSRRLTVVGVTGTDGKTTTTTMLHAAWRGSGIGAGSLTTVDFRAGDEVEPNRSRQTTLESADVQERLAELLGRGCTHVAMETSSHALVLHRVDAVDYDAAVFTRITSEHLDFHGSVEAYRAAKAHLAERVAENTRGLVVLDRDDDATYPRLAAIDVPRRLTYSASGRDADLRAAEVRADKDGVHLVARTPWGDAELQLRLAGRFNAANALAALAGACATGATLDGAVRGIAALERVSGRMERVDLGQPFAVVVDYAHTAQALRSVLTELRAATTGRLWVVFGSAGERDREKRPAMGAVAAEIADVVVVCDEDPREEDRDAIIEEIAAGARRSGARDGERLFAIADRSAAIAHAIGGAAAGDTVLLAGKGHESSILAGARTVAWDERGEAEAAIRRRLPRADSRASAR